MAKSPATRDLKHINDIDLSLFDMNKWWQSAINSLNETHPVIFCWWLFDMSLDDSLNKNNNKKKKKKKTDGLCWWNSLVCSPTNLISMDQLLLWILNAYLNISNTVDYKHRTYCYGI
jgi:hypothetical protein